MLKPTLALFMLFALVTEAQNSKLKPSLARSGVADAWAAAKQWKPDARLIQVAGRGIGEDGLALLWDYGFYSPTAKTCLVVKVTTPPMKRESGGGMCESPELQEFMDSDQAIKIARNNGITNVKASMVVSVPEPGKGAVWTVMDDAGVKPGNVIVDIDARTGKILSKITQK